MTKLAKCKQIIHSLCDVEDIEKWAHTKDLPEGLTAALLPGPTTLILKRKGTLNPLLNPGVHNVGIRVPKFDFVRSTVKMLNQPIALTSANRSDARSTLHPDEFEDLWPELDAVFYEKMSLNRQESHWRRGSTIVDLTVKGQFTIVRSGIGYSKTKRTLRGFKLKEHKVGKVKSDVVEEVPEGSEGVEEARASG